MKKIFLFLLLMAFITNSNLLFAQKEKTSERYGKTINLGVGIGGYSGYYGYRGSSMPVLHFDYEFDVANSFTLAPFVSFYSYSNEYYWGSKNHPYKNYYYHETDIPIGVKGTYYFDQLLNANSKWDFYLAGSLGFVVVNSYWDNDYYGDKEYYKTRNPLFIDLHIGTEYHFNNHLGMFLDLSSGVSTIGLAIH
ncbi:MAG: hypothetical protein WCK02_15030 [Bacteroidota bacterium]